MDPTRGFRLTGYQARNGGGERRIEHPRLATRRLAREAHDEGENYGVHQPEDF